MNEERVIYNSLEQLMEERETLYHQIHRAGLGTIFELLAKLYPDKAHFIYELLQNAEDVQATEVRFRLTSDHLDFWHDGKRNFNLEDIVAITGIGNNEWKKTDETVIGKFGVGFKAVFLYTETPEIHSGEYHFSIEHQIVPKLGVNKVSTVENGVSWTKFRFPFNHAEKPKHVAFSEIREGLRELDETSILFLRNIQRINVKIVDRGYSEERQIVQDKSKLPLSVIRVVESDNKEHTYTYFVCENEFYRVIQNSRKRLIVGAAFAVERKNGKWSFTEPRQGGKTFVYFPAAKERAGFRFHLNASFVTTVARDAVINDSKDNDKLISDLSQLMTDIICDMKHYSNEFSEDSLLSIMPNSNDYIDDYYMPIKSSIYETYRRKQVIPSSDGTYVNAGRALISRREIKKLFDKKFLGSIKEPYAWLQSPTPNTRAAQFMEDIGVERVNIRWFFESSVYGGLYLESYVAKSTNEWLLDFLQECQQECIREEDDWYYQDERLSDYLVDMWIILCSDGQRRKPEQTIGGF